MDRRRVTADRPVTVARRRLAVILVAALWSSNACSSSRTRDAATSDAPMSDAADAVADAGTKDAVEDAVAPDAIEDAHTRDSSGDTAVADASQDEQGCTQVCDLGTTIGCSTDSSACVSQCLQDLATPTCYAEKKAAQSCVIAAGPDAVTCMMGVTFVKTGYCQSEKGALTNCLRGLPPVDAGSD